MSATATKRPRRSRGTPTKPGTLAGMTEAMEILGVPRSTLNRWLERDEMPQPEDVIASGPVWRRQDLEAHAKRRTT